MLLAPWIVLITSAVCPANSSKLVGYHVLKYIVFQNHCIYVMSFVQIQVLYWDGLESVQYAESSSHALYLISSLLVRTCLTVHWCCRWVLTWGSTCSGSCPLNCRVRFLVHHLVCPKLQDPLPRRSPGDPPPGIPQLVPWSSWWQCLFINAVVFNLPGVQFVVFKFYPQVHCSHRGIGCPVQIRPPSTTPRRV